MQMPCSKLPPILNTVSLTSLLLFAAALLIPAPSAAAEEPLPAAADRKQETDAPHAVQPRFGIDSKFSLITGYRASEIFEQTGNEDTFFAYLKNGTKIEHRFSWGKLFAETEFYLLGQLSPKGRIFEGMNPPPFMLEKLALGVSGHGHRFKIGMLTPLVNTLPFETINPPILYNGGGFTAAAENGESNQFALRALTAGFRDSPILYAGLIDRFDLGIEYQFSYKAFSAAAAFVNGEQGLDANSAKSGAFRISLLTPKLYSGLAGQIGNYGSVPIKEWRHLYKLFFFWGDRFKFGFETLIYLHGLSGNASLSDYQSLKEKFLYGGAFFNEFTSLSGSVPFGSLIGVSSVFYVILSDLLWKRLKVIAHYSLHDSDIKRGSDPYSQLKHRIFLRISFEILPGFAAVVSDTWSYDPVYYSYKQFYEKEPRAVHYQADNDLLIGFSYTRRFTGSFAAKAEK